MGVEGADGTRFKRSVPLLVGGCGTVLLLWSIAEPVALLVRSSPDVFRLRYVIGYVTLVPSALVLMWGGRWLAASEISPEYNYLIGGASFAGGGAFLVFNFFLMFFFPTDSVWIVTNWIRWAFSLGTSTGFVIGALYSRGLFEQLTAERHSLRAEHVQEQRELVDHLNGILRHEVLNSAQIIQGNAEILMASDERIDPDDERLARLHQQGYELEDVIQEVRALLNTIEGDRRLRRIRLSDVIERAVEKVESNHPEVDIRTSVPDDVFVEGDELIGRVFGNLLRNAAEHNPSASLLITVDVEATDEGPVVTIRDNGDGIPEHQLETLFDRPQVGTHGLGLYLVKALVDSYAGEIELVGTGSDGTTFTVSFPPAGAPHVDRGRATPVPDRG